MFLRRRRKLVVQTTLTTDGALSNSCDKAGQFQGKPLEKILVLEIFAGAGRLTAALRDKGFTSMAIDKDPSRSKQVHIVLTWWMRLKGIHDYS